MERTRNKTGNVVIDKLKGYSLTKIIAIAAVIGMVFSIGFALGMGWAFHQTAKIAMQILGDPQRLADLERLITKYILIQ